MKKLYILLTLFYFSISFANALETKDLALSDSILIEIKSIENTDSISISNFYKDSKTLKDAMSIENLQETLSILHLNKDTIYSNNQAAYSVAQLLIDKFFLVNDKLITQYANLFANGKDQFIDYNLKKYLSRYFFQLFYAKGSQAELLRTDVQEAMQPKIIDDMIKKDLNLERIQHEMIFIARNSNIKLYNL